MSVKGRKPLWKCPQCGHRFVTKNMWHSCGSHRLRDHFRGKDPAVRRLFETFRMIVRECGPVTIYAQKTRIVFQGTVRFAGAMPRKRWLDVALWLTQRHDHPALHKIEFIPLNAYSHHFRIRSSSEFDAAFRRLVRDAYAIGQRAHLV